MARSPKPQEEQLALIDVDDPKLKAVKKLIVSYEALKAANATQSSENKESEKAKRQQVFQALKDAELKPDNEGAYHVQMGGSIYDITQDAQLKIKRRKAPSTDAQEPAEDPDE